MYDRDINVEKDIKMNTIFLDPVEVERRLSLALELSNQNIY